MDHGRCFFSCIVEKLHLVRNSWFVEHDLLVMEMQRLSLSSRLWIHTKLLAGPGCSSIAYGLAEELGPFHINADGKSLYLNPYTWNQGNAKTDYLVLDSFLVHVMSCGR